MTKGMGNMMKQAQKLQSKIFKLQEELADKTVETTVGGGMVKAVANGKQELLSIKIDPEVVDPSDVQMLEDLITAAVNDDEVDGRVQYPRDDVAMEFYPQSLIRLIKHLSKLPGIGEKTAARLALHILRSSDADAKALSESILEVKEKIRFCSRCFGLCETDPCRICANAGRDHTMVCVVEHPNDLVALEKSGAFSG
jgi:DNA-binding YbaB/EbfC family protein